MNALVRFKNYIAEATREASIPLRKAVNGTLAPVGGWPWWPGRILESYAGAWQENVVVDRQAVTAYWAVFACTTLISSDISKLPIRVMSLESNAVSKATKLRPVLQTPNHYQTSLEFFFNWVMSELIFGNTYILKRRNEQRFVDAMYVLDPCRVVPLIAPDGSVYYSLNADNLSNIEQSVIVPASEIIHDRMYTIHHPLMGVSPIYACGVAAMQGLAIQDNSTKFFQNMSRPSGILTAPGAISTDVASRLKENWEANFSTSNIGRVAVLGDGLKYEPMAVNAHDSQLIEQLKMSAEMVAACYHVPAYKIGVGQMPTVNNTATLNQQYYDQCLQYIIEKLERRLDEGLELQDPDFCEFDTSVLLRMDPSARYDSHQKAIAGSWKTPNEVRLEENLVPVSGGSTVYMQSQNQSLAALDKRDQDSIAGNADVQTQAMNGAQVTSLIGTLEKVSTGVLSKESAIIAINSAFPLLEDDDVRKMVEAVKVTGPVPPAGAPPSSFTQTDEPAVDDAPEDVTQQMLTALLSKDLESLCHANS